MALRRASVPFSAFLFLFGLLLIDSTAKAFSIEDYDANIAKALKGEFTILGALENGIDFGTEDASLNKLLKALYKRFSTESFAIFLSKQGNSLDIPGFRIASNGIKGEGGFGTVFAMSAETRANISSSLKNIRKMKFEIAVKMLKATPKKNLDKYGLEVELNNMKFLATTKSAEGGAFAVPYFGAFIDKSGQAFILTQLMSESLSDYTTKPEKVLSDADIDRLITSLGGGLANWHALGFVHNDIKADNIMRDSNGNFYFIDFGTTRKLTPAQMRDGNLHVDRLKGRKGTLMANIGTPAMMSPEKILDDRSVLGPMNWGESDVYSFGMALWAVLSHQSEPALFKLCTERGSCSERFHRGDMREEDFNAFRAFVQGTIPVGPREPRAIKAAKRLVVRLLAWRPSDRPSNVLAGYREELR